MQSTRTDAPDHTNFVGTGFYAPGKDAAVTLSYARLITGQLLIGVTGMTGNDDDSKQGGSLDNAQYYMENYEYKSSKAEINSTFYFRDQGYARWGFLLKGGVGHAWNKAKATWERYDRDPAVFRIFGDDKRLRESGGQERKWESTYARLGAYYQMTFNVHPTSPVGHILQFGVAGMKQDQSKKIGYTKADGGTVSRKIPDSSVGAELSYSISF
jgi:hypothetical protein